MSIVTINDILQFLERERYIYIYIYIDYRYVDATNKSMSKYSSNGIFH